MTEHGGELRIRWSVVIQVAGYVVMALLTYAAIESRVSVIESRQSDADRRLVRIEDKLDRLLEKP